MELAAAALCSLLPKLGTLLTDEFKLQKGVREEIKFLQTEMESMQAALNVLSKLPADRINDLDTIWARNLKELSYDIEDSIDTFMVHIDTSDDAKPHGFRRFFERTSLLTKAKTRHHIATDMEEIRRRIHEVADRRQRYRFEDALPYTTNIDPRLPAIYEDAAKLIGIDGPTEQLVDLLTRGKALKKQKLMVVSIVGVGGLGKTTVANSVYQRLRGEFQSQAFVSVSLKPDITKIFSSILRQVSGMEYPSAEAWNHTELIEKIRQILEKNRYIIVLDDIWDKNVWTYIKCVLVDNNLGNRVIVTTRNTDVAESCSGSDDTLYKLHPLSDADSKSLFHKRIFDDKNVIHPELEEVSDKILRKCGGVPLAIVTIASLLASKRSKTMYEWTGVYESMGTGLDKSMENMRGILSLSYCDLPPCLKPCLLYLSIFPEDFDIEIDCLVQRWVAEGFVEQQGQNMYEVGHSYFIELVNRNMIQLSGTNKNGSARTCRVHDMILDLIISLSSEENFATVLGHPQLASPLCKIYRLSLQASMDDSNEMQVKLPANVDMSHVRSLTAFGYSSKWMVSLSRFALLRVLHMDFFDSKSNLLKDIGSLHLLRFLALKGELETEHLKGIGKLKNLRTLDLRKCRIQELPASIAQLQKLECLLVNVNRVSMKGGIGDLRSLQVLTWLDTRESPDSLAELAKLTELRVLSIFGIAEKKSYAETFLKSLSNLRKIRTLNFDGSGFCSFDCMSDPCLVAPRLKSFDGGSTTFYQLPRWFSLFFELSHLSIRLNIKNNDLDILGALPVLRFLELEAAHSSDNWLVIDNEKAFFSLEEFHFVNDTTSWLLFASGVMSKLQSLVSFFKAWNFGKEGRGCFFGLENLTSLKHVKIEVGCHNASNRQIIDVEADMREAMVYHPNNPVLQLSRCGGMRP